MLFIPNVHFSGLQRPGGVRALDREGVWVPGEGGRSALAQTYGSSLPLSQSRPT